LKILRLGDPHVKPSNVDESDRIMEMVLYLAKKYKVDRIEILGDLFHTHAVLRIEVLEFWTKWLSTFSHEFPTIAIVGNHDQPGDHNLESHSLSVFKTLNIENLVIVDKPTQIGIYGYLPYQHGHERFAKSVRKLADSGAKVLVCHQTLGGVQYENGFYAPDTIDPAAIGFSFNVVISGHIHKRQIIKAGNIDIVYPGTARWDTISDANEQKGITIYEHDDETGKILSSEFFSTDKICSPIISVEWKQEDTKPALPDNPNARLNIELIGTSDWIKEQKEFLKGKASIKARITDSKLAQRNPGGNILEFMRNSFQTQLDLESLIDFMKEEGLV
jgi:DNA repair exonuclease SbcCD nuclease subunit